MRDRRQSLLEIIRQLDALEDDLVDYDAPSRSLLGADCLDAFVELDPLGEDLLERELAAARVVRWSSTGGKQEAGGSGPR